MRIQLHHKIQLIIDNRKEDYHLFNKVTYLMKCKDGFVLLLHQGKDVGQVNYHVLSS